VLKISFNHIFIWCVFQKISTLISFQICFVIFQFTLQVSFAQSLCFLILVICIENKSINEIHFVTNGSHWKSKIVSKAIGMLIVPGIAGYEWVPARICRFFQNKIFFHYTNGQLKTGEKTGTHLSADTSPVHCSLSKGSSKKKSHVLWGEGVKDFVTAVYKAFLI